MKFSKHLISYAQLIKLPPSGKYASTPFAELEPEDLEVELYTTLFHIAQGKKLPSIEDILDEIENDAKDQ